MRPVAFFLLAVATLAAMSAALIFENKLPECANACGVLRGLEKVCLRPDIDLSKNSTLVRCICEQPATSIVIDTERLVCTDQCNPTDAETIAIVYRDFCSLLGLPEAASTRIPFTSLPHMPSKTLSGWTTLLGSAPSDRTGSPAPPHVTGAFAPPHPAGQTFGAKHHEDWFRSNWKCLVIGGILIVVTFCVIFGLAFFFRHRKTLGPLRQHRGPIALTILRRRRSKSGESSARLQDSSSSILQPPPPSAAESFPAHLRLYAQEVQDLEENKKRKQEWNELRKMSIKEHLGLGP
ncbi:hypothetical protein CC86DRAFT_424114 [Ophiobolus disseminans]|uniref:Extracellular membrane protein CFEM domain-containing protein n=1 Tax=Ophiobolus disseminans TaxID=1469910 RepID=A0A6A7AGN2_9PLEO|nr:hypothetical protein CC86DRAFT_424114 [Ophiobolus disseminans]